MSWDQTLNVDPGWREQLHEWSTAPGRWALLRYRWEDQLAAIAPHLLQLVETELKPLENEHTEMLDEIRNLQVSASMSEARANQMTGAAKEAEEKARNAQTSARKARADLGDAQLDQAMAHADARDLVVAVDHLITMLNATEPDESDRTAADLLTEDQAAALERHRITEDKDGP